jgi:hypothetical protein
MVILFSPEDQTNDQLTIFLTHHSKKNMNLFTCLSISPRSDVKHKPVLSNAAIFASMLSGFFV